MRFNKGYFITACLLAILLFNALPVYAGFTPPMDIQPGSCPNALNCKAGGVISVAILGTSGIDVSVIDPSTIELEGVAALRWDIDDVSTPFTDPLEDCFACNTLGADGMDDLVLKFNRQEVVEAIGPVTDGECIELELTGELFDGAPFNISDNVLIRHSCS